MDRSSRDTLAIDREQEWALQARMRYQAKTSAWPWLLPILLLTTALAVPQLDTDAFHHDELFSMLAAGILRSGPHSLADVWNYIAELDPHQAQGWPLLLSVWGYNVGWSVLAARTLPLFAGILTLALVFRTGNDLFAAPTGLIATLLLAGSAFFFAYLSIARAFTLVALFTTLVLWSYWRIALQPRPPGRGAQAGLLLGSIGLLWSHYFTALFLPALVLFHLLFVPKTRRWWQPVLLVGLAVLVATLQLPGFLSGLNKTVANEALRQIAISATEIPERFLYYLTNLLVTLPPTVAAASLAAVAAGAAGRHPATPALRQARRRRLAACLRGCHIFLVDDRCQRGSQDDAIKPDSLPDAAVAPERPAGRCCAAATCKPAASAAGRPAGSVVGPGNVYQPGNQFSL